MVECSYLGVESSGLHHRIEACSLEMVVANDPCVCVWVVNISAKWGLRHEFALTPLLTPSHLPYTWSETSKYLDNRKLSNVL